MKKGINIEKTLGVLFFASIFLNIGFSYGQIYFFHLLIPVISLFILVKKSRVLKIKKIVFRKLNLAFIAIFLFYCISIIWAENRSYALVYIAQFGIGVFALLCSQFFIYNKKTFYYYSKTVFATMLLLVCCVSLLEIYTDFRWPISRLSYYNSLFGRTNYDGKDLTPENMDYVLSSPTAFFWNQNHLAVFLCIWLPFFMKKKAKDVLIFTVLTIIIVYTASRFTLLSIAVILLISIFFNKRNALFLIYFIGLLVAPIYIIPNTSYAVKANEPVAKIITLNKNGLKEDAGDHSQSIRLQLYKQGVTDIIESKFIGVGAGNARWKNELQKENTLGITDVHFYWLEMLINGGIIVLLLISFIMISLLLYFFKQKNSFVKKSLLLSMLMFSSSIISLSSAVYFLPFYALIGVLISVKNNKIGSNV